MLLAFDTTLDVCSVALLDNAGALAAHISRPMARGHAEALVPMIDEALREAGTGMEALERIAVTTGPGTFTGVRVGVSAARGLALALKLPVAGVTTMDMLAGAVVFSGKNWGENREISKILAAIDARRSQAYLALFEGGDAANGYPLRCLAAPAVVALEDARGWLDGNCAAGEEVRVIGSAAEILAAQDDRLRFDIADLTPDAGVVARLAACLPAGRWTGKPQALYLRAPDAKLPAGIK